MVENIAWIDSNGKPIAHQGSHINSLRKTIKKLGLFFEGEPEMYDYFLNDLGWIRIFYEGNGELDVELSEKHVSKKAVKTLFRLIETNYLSTIYFDNHVSYYKTGRSITFDDIKKFERFLSPLGK